MNGIGPSRYFAIRRTLKAISMELRCQNLGFREQYETMKEMTATRVSKKEKKQRHRTRSQLTEHSKSNCGTKIEPCSGCAMWLARGLVGVCSLSVLFPPLVCPILSQIVSRNVAGARFKLWGCCRGMHYCLYAYRGPAAVRQCCGDRGLLFLRHHSD
jgi:hypothetical protein